MKKAVALLLAAIMCMGIFAACGKDEKGADKDNSNLQNFPSPGFGDKDKSDDSTDSKNDTPEKPEEKPSVWADKLMYVDANGEWHFVDGMDGNGTDTPLGVYTKTNIYGATDPYIDDNEGCLAYASDGEYIFFVGNAPDNKYREIGYVLGKDGKIDMLVQSEYISLEQKGDVVLLGTSEKTLYSCINGKAVKLAEDVSSPYISDDGMGVWFSRREDKKTVTFWYVRADGNAPLKKVAEIQGVYRVYYGMQENVLIYTAENESSDSDQESYSIYISRAGKTPELLINNTVGASFGEYGDTFFYYSKESGKKALYWYDGEKSVLAADIGINELGDSDLKMPGENKNQKIYYVDSRLKDGIHTHTYVYKYGDITGTVNCSTESSYYYSNACGFLNGQEVFVTCGDKLVIHSINSQDPDDSKVIDIYDVTFLPETETLFYETDDGSLYVYENGESRLLMSSDSWPKLKKLYGDKTVITLDGKYEDQEVLYIQSGTLKIKSSDGQPETMGENCTFFAYTREGRLLFVIDKVLYCYDGENTVRIADNALWAYPGTLDRGQ